MIEKPDSLHAIGLVKEAEMLLAAQLSFRRGTAALDETFEIMLQPSEGNGSNVNPLYISDSAEMKQLENVITNNLAVSVIETSDVIIRPLEVKLKKEADIDAVLYFQAEPLLPYPPENGILDRVKLSQTSDGTQLIIQAVQKNRVQQHLDGWHAMKIEPEVVTSAPTALSAFCNTFYPTESSIFAIHFGENETTCVLISNKQLLAAQTCPDNLKTLFNGFIKDRLLNSQVGLQAFKEEFKQLDFSTVTPENFPALSESLDTFCLDLTRTIYALAKQTKGKEISEIVITGEGGCLTNLAEILCAKSNKHIIRPTSTAAFQLSQNQLQKFAIPIGAALTALPNYSNQVNFRQEEFSYPNPWKRYKRPVFTYLALCILLAFAFYLFGQAYISYEKDEVRRQYADLLDQVNKPYHEFEKEFLDKTSSTERGNEESIKPIQELTPKQIVERANILQKDVQAIPDIFALLPNVPRVSDVLAWLATNPHVVIKDSNDKSQETATSLQIENFSYQLVKKPDQTKKQEKYQVKVELEFSSPTPKLAREFHDALIAPNEIVDPKGEIKWSTNRGKYRTSFYLKDKTVYPSSGT